MVTSNINYLVQQSQFCHYPANPQGCHSWGGAGSHAKCSQSTSHSSPAPKCSEADLPKCIGGKKSPLLSFRNWADMGRKSSHLTTDSSTSPNPQPLQGKDKPSKKDPKIPRREAS